MRLDILLVCGMLTVGFAEQLPSFIKKCSLTDPEVAKCVITSGNLAIPEIVKGSRFFGVPPAMPLHISALNLLGSDFTVNLSNVRLSGLENFRIKYVRFYTLRYSSELLMTAPYLNLTADYIIVSNDFFFPRILETGRLDTTLAEIVFMYAGGGRLSRGGYLMFAGDDVKFQSERIFYRYSDLHVSSTGNFLDFLNVHKRIIDERITPGVREILHKFITAIPVNLFKKLPKDGYFDE